MSGEVEAIGQMATAGLIAGALDPPAAPRDQPPATDSCRNCGAALSGHFCAQCGQSAHVHRSIGHVFEELLHGIVHFDGKAWRTLPLLAWRPGRLTYDYVHGHRARYIAPVPMFLLSVFLMFLVFGFTGGVPIGGDMGDMGFAATKPAETRAERVGQAETARRQLAKLDAELRAVEQKSAAADAAPLRYARDLAAEQAARATRAIDDPASALAPGESAWARELRRTVERGDVRISSPSPAIDAKVRKALLAPEFTLYKIQQKAYKLSFLLVPLSVPWLWLLFAFRRGATLYDHSVFVLYSLSFMSLLFIAATLIAQTGVDNSWLWITLTVLVPVAHVFAQLKEAYQLTAWGAAWRTFVLVQASLLTLALFLLVILLLGLLD